MGFRGPVVQIHSPRPFPLISISDVFLIFLLLNFRQINSPFSHKRKHPVLKICWPHHGIDYAAPRGTPVSEAGDGMVIFSGKRECYGNLVILQHLNGCTTYYAHLSKICSGAHSGKKVTQGEIIGQVGPTEIETDSHRHFETRINDTHVNPISVKIAHGGVIA